MIFTKEQEVPIAATIEAPRAIVDMWIPRTTQLSMVEAIAVPIAAYTFREKIRGKRILWMIDAASVFGSIVKEYPIQGRYRQRDSDYVGADAPIRGGGVLREDPDGWQSIR